MEVKCNSCGQKLPNLPKIKGKIPVVFLIDDNGIDLFSNVRDSMPFVFYDLRARYNSHKNMKFGIALISEEVYNEIHKLADNFEMKKARDRLLQEEDSIVYK